MLARPVLAVVVLLSLSDRSAAQTMAARWDSLPSHVRSCTTCADGPPRGGMPERESVATRVSPVITGEHTNVSSSTIDRIAIGSAIGAAAGVALGAVISSDRREQEEGFSQPMWMLGLGLLGALIGAIGGALSR